MSNAVYLKVKDEEVLSTKITYDDLVWLYNNFRDTYGKLPTTNDGKAKYNMPQQRIIKRVLEENNITFNDFMLQFRKVSHVRTESRDYSLFVEKYKTIGNEIGRALTQRELTNNEYGLPSASWFVKYCPDKSIKNYDDFVHWCGFESNKLKKDDEVVAQKLIQLEKDLGRPITRNDITIDNVGFSSIVVNRIWGNLTNAKQSLGLAKTPPIQPRSFEFYEEKLLNVLDKISKNKNRKFISWDDIESLEYSDNPTEHKTYLKAFKRQGIDFISYLKNKGFEMNIGKMGYCYTFYDGERTKSIYEYDFSDFLRNELNLVYNKDYFRDVLYSTFTGLKSKLNCDYILNINNINLYIEIAGVIYNTNKDNWREIQYNTKRETEYKETMIYKEGLLKENNKLYIILFPWDMKSGKYKEIIKSFTTENTI